MCSLVLPILSAVNACRMRRRIGPPSLRSRAHAGHVPRNMRLALAGIDLLRPHVTAWLPSAAEQPPPGACIRMHWVVWGAIDIDETEGLWRQSASHSWMHVPFDRSVVGTFGSPIGGLPQLDAFAHDHAGGARPGIGRPHGREMLTRSQQSPGAAPKLLQINNKGNILGGEGVWGGTNSPFQPLALGGCLRLPAHAIKAGRQQLAVRVKADSAWAAYPSAGAGPARKRPQTHLALSRSKYSAANGARRVLGSDSWISAPVEVNCSFRMVDSKSSVAECAPLATVYG